MTVTLMELQNVKQIVQEMSLVGIVMEELPLLLLIVIPNVKTEFKQALKYVTTELQSKIIRSASSIALVLRTAGIVLGQLELFLYVLLSAETQK